MQRCHRAAIVLAVGIVAAPRSVAAAPGTLEVRPASLVYPVLDPDDLGSSATLTLTLANVGPPGADPVEVAMDAHPVLSHPAFVMNPAGSVWTLEPGWACVVEITFAPRTSVLFDQPIVLRDLHTQAVLATVGFFAGVPVAGPARSAGGRHQGPRRRAGRVARGRAEVARRC